MNKKSKELLKEFCKYHINNQKHKIKLFRKMPNQILMRDNCGNYKVATKYYYCYYIEEDEYDTETELPENDVY